ncbi:MAG TPA: hypothetical protein VKU00_26130 [Chthonomonadaceae bacterium]|nr:hypothetical protein [Chthonomonadaceae bacterium]
MIAKVFVTLAVPCLGIGAACLFIGYGLLLLYACQTTNLRGALQRLWRARDYRRIDLRAGGLVYLGAAFCGLALLLILGAILLARR